MSLFLISDTHFGHVKSCSFVDANGSKTRPWDTVEAMDEAMVERWNAVVKPQDTVYHLGDVAIPRQSLKILGRLNGRKALIRGNHDIFKLSDYTEFFYDIRGAFVNNDRFLFSHIPCHRGSVERYRGNIHGHLHTGRITLPDGTIDPLYYSVCVEHTNFAPIAWEVVKAEMESLQSESN